MLTNEKYNIYKNRYISRLSIVPCLAILHNNSPSFKVFKKKVSLLNISFRIRRLLNHGGFKPFLRGIHLKYKENYRMLACVIMILRFYEYINGTLILHTFESSFFASSKLASIDIRLCKTDL